MEKFRFPLKGKWEEGRFLQGKEFVYDFVTHNLGKTSNIYKYLSKLCQGKKKNVC